MKINKKIFIIVFCFLVVVILRIALTYNYRIHVINSGEDDALMVNWALSMMDGKWLGDYRYNTLMKGPIFSYILVVLHRLNIKYFLFVNVFYVASCLLFILSIRKIIKNKYLLILFFIVLAFNPVMFSREVTQRVYRNSLIPSFAMILVSGYIGAFLNSKDSLFSYFFYIGTLCITLPLFYYTREDSIWLVPFVIFMTISTFVLMILNMKNTSKLILGIKCLVLFIPIVSVFLLGQKIERKNEIFYGLRTQNVLSDSNFTDAIKAIYSVRPNVTIDRVTVTQEKAFRMANASLSFLEIYPKLVELMVGYNAFDSNPNDFECEDGWFLWALRLAVSSSGYSNIQQEQDIYKRIADELNNAMYTGVLERQHAMPSALLSPYHKGYARECLNRIPKCFEYIVSCKDIYIQNKVDVTTDEEKYQNEVYRVEKLTNEKASLEVGKENGEYEELVINTKIISFIIFIYKFLGIVFLILGIIMYIVLIVMGVINIKNKKYDIIKSFIVTSGALGLMFTLIVGISYNDVATADSIKVLYLCGAYPLLFVFCILSLYFGVNSLRDYIICKKNKVDEGHAVS